MHPRRDGGGADYARAVPCRCQETLLEKERQSYLERFSNLAPLARLTFDTFESRRRNLTVEQQDNLERALTLAKEFAQNRDGWLVLQGVNGCGKTHLAAAVGNYQLKHRRQVLFISVPDLLDHLRSTFSPESPVTYDELFERVRNAPLLILDDLGEHAATPWAREKLYQIFNHRYNARLATVITTSIAVGEIEPRIASRMVDPRVSNLFNITAPDYRSDLRPNKPRPLPRRRTGPD